MRRLAVRVAAVATQPAHQPLCDDQLQAAGEQVAGDTHVH